MSVDKSTLTGGRQDHVGRRRRRDRRDRAHARRPVPRRARRRAARRRRRGRPQARAPHRERHLPGHAHHRLLLRHGLPSTAIGVEELANAGARIFIRVGSTAALQEGMAISDLVVIEGSYRNDGTTAAYVPPGYPAVPDLRLTIALECASRRLAAEHGFGVRAGLNATDDAFWAETPEHIANLSRLGLLNVEMESSAIFGVTRRRGLRAGMVCAVSGNLVTGDVVRGEDNTRLRTGWVHSVTPALEAVHALSAG